MLRGVHTFLLLALLLALPAQAQDATPATTEPSPPPSGASQADLESAPPPSYEITGAARSGKTHLPGTPAPPSNPPPGKTYLAVTETGHKFTFTGIVRGRYVLRI